MRLALPFKPKAVQGHPVFYGMNNPVRRNGHRQSGQKVSFCFEVSGKQRPGKKTHPLPIKLR
jgi:hypothetical protein